MKANLKSTNELVQIAAAASNSGARIIFTGLKIRQQNEIIQIAAAGKGCVFFDDEIES